MSRKINNSPLGRVDNSSGIRQILSVYQMEEQQEEKEQAVEPEIVKIETPAQETVPVEKAPAAENNDKNNDKIIIKNKNKNISNYIEENSKKDKKVMRSFYINEEYVDIIGGLPHGLRSRVVNDALKDFFKKHGIKTTDN